MAINLGEFRSIPHGIRTVRKDKCCLQAQIPTLTTPHDIHLQLKKAEHKTCCFFANIKQCPHIHPIKLRLYEQTWFFSHIKLLQHDSGHCRMSLRSFYTLTNTRKKRNVSFYSSFRWSHAFLHLCVNFMLTLIKNQ